MDRKAGNLIRRLRQELGITQEDLAYEVGVAVSTVTRCENAHSQPNRVARKTIRDLASSRRFGDLAGAPQCREADRSQEARSVFGCHC